MKNEEIKIKKKIVINLRKGILKAKDYEMVQLFSKKRKRSR